jgi:pimeloyl-ACP methyl ester carboxylesterase
MTLPIVLLHAFPVSARMWAPLLTVLPPGLEVLAPDLRGAPGAPVGDVRPSLDAMADDVVRLLDERGIERAIVGGVSMGGYVTMALLRRHAERVAGLVLADTRAAADTDDGRTNRLAMAAELETAPTTRVLFEKTMPTLIGPTSKAQRPQVVSLVREMIEATPPASAAWWQRAMAERPDSFDTLKAVRVPALVVVGAEDELTPPDNARAMVDVLDDATLVELAGVGHFSALESPEPFAQALVAFADRLSDR